MGARNQRRRTAGAIKSRLLSVAVALVLAVGGGAAAGREGPQPLWPPLPDQPRFQYEYTLRTIGDIVPDKESTTWRQFLTGELEGRSKQLLFEKPGAVAARLGRIYVTDLMRNVGAIIDVPRRRIFPFGVREDGGKLNKPVAIALDGEQNVYVLDAGARKVHVYDHLGLYSHSLGNPKDFERPTGIAVAPAGDRVYVVDRSTLEANKPRLVCYAADGKTLFTLDKAGDGAGELHIPLQVAAGKDGRFYVLDSGNFRVQAFDRDGKHLFSFGQLGAGPGTFARPRGLAVDDDGLVYVSDATFGNVQVFDPDGQLLLVIGDKENEGKDKSGIFPLIGGLAVDETRRLYVIDQFYRKVDVIRRLSEEEGRRLTGESD